MDAKLREGTNKPTILGNVELVIGGGAGGAIDMCGVFLNLDPGCSGGAIDDGRGQGRGGSHCHSTR